MIITINDDVYVFSEHDSFHAYVDQDSPFVRFIFSGRDSSCYTNVESYEKAKEIIKEIKSKILEGKKTIQITFKEELVVKCD